MTDSDLVSILIPVRNCERWLGAAIDSALRQTWPKTEVVVLDDGSTDNTLRVIRSFGSAVRWSSDELGGQNRARNRLLELSKGEWLTFLDADDELAPDCIEQKMLSTRDSDAIYGSMEVADFVDGRKIASYVDVAENFQDVWAAAFRWRLPGIWVGPA